MNRHLLALGLLTLLVACGGPDWAPSVAWEDGAVAVRSELPVERVELFDGDGAPLLRRTLPAPLHTPRFEARFPADEEITVVLQARGQSRRLTLRTGAAVGAVALRIEAPMGQELRPVADGDLVEFEAIEGIGSRIALRLTAVRVGEVRVALCDQERTLQLGVVGEQAEVVAAAPTSGDCAGRVEADGERTSFVLRPIPATLAEARAALRIEQVAFPADSLGKLDSGRAPGRVTLPSPWWRSVLHTTKLGARARAVETPWAWSAVHVRNDGERPVNAVVRLRVEGPDGSEAPAFRSRVRAADGDTGTVTGLLRIPAGSTSVAVLPMFVDEGELTDRASAWTRRIELTPLGSDAPLLSKEAPLYVRRGSTATSVGFAATLASMLAGLLLLMWRLGPWLRRTSTSELVTIALFANLMFFFSAASHLLGLGAATVLGPFSSLVTGLVDDAFRYALLATLVTLLPRPGVVTIAILVHYMMRALALGGFQPTDPILLASAVLWLEGGLWLTGVTRSGDWRDEQPLRRFARLGLAFTVASVVGLAVGLVVAAVLYRLYFAAWYVALVLAVPGLLYTAVACWLATGFAASLRRVEG